MKIMKLLLISCSLSIIYHVDSQQQKSTRIFGGMEAKEDQFPYMVDLSVNYRGKFYHLCGATLIHYYWILTAGHCAYYAVATNSKLNATFGVADMTNGPHKWSELIEPKNIIIHENYTDDGETAVDDLSLLKLGKPISYGARVLPVSLPNPNNFEKYEGQIGTISGWGLNVNRQKNEPNVLQFYEEVILSNEECTAQNVNYPRAVASEICISSQNGKTACPGDSGSPLVVRNETHGEILVGITSYVDIGSICDSENNGPVVFMRISYYMDWIENKTKVKFN